MAENLDLPDSWWQDAEEQKYKNLSKAPDHLINKY